MERGGGSVAAASCYYAVLGIRKDASSDEIRTAYRKLAMRWHPDKWTRDPHVAGEAKRRFQLIQEAYSVLSDQSKRSMYDAGLYDPLEVEDEDFCDFMHEMISMMNNVKEDEGDSFEDLQRMFQEMVDEDGSGVRFDFSVESTAAIAGPKKMTALRRTAGPKKMTAPRRTAGPKKMTAPRRTAGPKKMTASRRTTSRDFAFKLA